VPDIFRTADRFRRDLLRRDRAATTEMVRRYGQIWKALKTEIDKLTRQYYAAAAAGEATSPAWVFQLGRLQSLQRQVEAELAAYARWAETSIRVEQWEATQAAQRHAAAMIEAAYGETVAAQINFQRLPAAALEDLIGFTQSGSPLFDLLAELGASAAEAVKEGLITGLALGKSPRDTARDIRQALGGDLARALRIARTETMRAYRESTRRAYEANANVVEGWIWHCGLDNRTCAACWAMHGTEHPITEILDDHPNGRCAMVPKTKPLAELGKELGVDLSGVPETRVEIEKGSDLFDKLDPAEQLKILGPAKYKAWTEGKFTLAKLVGRSYNKKWGSHRYERSLRAILGDDAKNYYAGGKPSN